MTNSIINPQKVTTDMDDLETVYNYIYLGQVIMMNESIIEEINNLVKFA